MRAKSLKEELKCPFEVVREKKDFKKDTWKFSLLSLSLFLLSLFPPSFLFLLFFFFSLSSSLVLLSELVKESLEVYQFGSLWSSQKSARY